MNGLLCWIVKDKVIIPAAIRNLPVIVSRKENNNVVIISETGYNELTRAKNVYGPMQEIGKLER